MQVSLWALYSNHWICESVLYSACTYSSHGFLNISSSRMHDAANFVLSPGAGYSGSLCSPCFLIFVFYFCENCVKGVFCIFNLFSIGVV